jgi:Fic family protein
MDSRCDGPTRRYGFSGACLDVFERFIHEDASRLPPLIKAGVLHVQFGTIDRSW